MSEDALARLQRGAAQLEIELPGDSAGQMLDYLQLLGEWNRAYNLTAITDLAQQLSHHLLDSLSVLPFLHGERIADIGSGAGLPGIPLALAQPQRRFTLVEATAKKTRFLRHALRVLGLANVEIVTARIEDYRPPSAFDTVVARALAALPRLTELSAGLLATGGRLLAMKGREPVEEMKEVGPAWGILATHRLVVPELAAERHLIVIEKK
ncbi:MAG: 16S rRNA (guanine(527)-N(7))-methyltransferase RsmG [Gammaproteobacteria bacterium]|nr:16S rRNA (guanine(527)-N(7))-methyltransferase RsmG [Gammaproteobacteria bacterium]